MRIVNVNLEVDKDGWARLNTPGDSHIGTKCADKRGLGKSIEEIAEDENGYVITMGDEVDAIPPKDSRFNLEDLDINEDKIEELGAEQLKKLNKAELLEAIKKIQEYKTDGVLRFIHNQYEYIENLLEPIAKEKRLIGMIAGNHGSKYAQDNAYNELTRICKRFSKTYSYNCHYLGEMAVVNATLTKKGKPIRTWVLHISHGYGGGYELASAVSRISKEPGIIMNAAAHIAGHSHKLFSFNDVIGMTTTTDGELKAHYACFINTGSFLKAYEMGIDSYGQKKHYKPNPLGYVVIHLSKDRIIPETKIVDRNMIWGI